METTLTFAINTDHLVDEMAQCDPYLFQELHYDRQAVKQAVETLLRILIVSTKPIISQDALSEDKVDVPHVPPSEEEPTAPDSCIWFS